ncbi:MAG: hypothetical protein H7Y41_00520, partial [Hyphomonadaceae bacterium]|nr:hypothetical protein [Clostridia bacterium]
ASREKMLDNFLLKKDLNGMALKEVTDTFGEPDKKEKDNKRISYKMPDNQFLTIDFDDKGKVDHFNDTK